MIRTCTLLIAALTTLSTTAQTVINEGTGTRRAALDKMVYQPAPTTMILQGDEWIGAAPTLGDISGKPMLVFTWAEWYRPSHAVAMLANRLGDEFPDLVVIGVHDDEGWEEAQTFAERRRLSFPIVRDADGSIRSELRVDQDPDVYVFDRAGQVRYADITTESVRTAVAEVAGEDSDAAANIESARAQRQADAERERRLSRGINEGVGLESVLNVPFVAPSAEEYAAAEWPERAEDPNERRRSRRGEDGPVAIQIPADGYFQGRVPNVNGRVVVMHVWHPAERYTIEDVMPLMDRVQQQYSRDVVVVGVLGRHAAVSERRRGNEELAPIFRVPINNDTIEQYVGSRRLSQYLVASEGATLPPLPGSRRRDDNPTFGSIGIISTDGILRRHEQHTEWEELRRALDTVLRVDPGVKARRAAEDAFIRAGG